MRQDSENRLTAQPNATQAQKPTRQTKRKDVMQQMPGNALQKLSLIPSLPYFCQVEDPHCGKAPTLANALVCREENSFCAVDSSSHVLCFCVYSLYYHCYIAHLTKLCKILHQMPV